MVRRSFVCVSAAVMGLSLISPSQGAIIGTYGDSLVAVGNSSTPNNGRAETYLRLRSSEQSAAIIGFDLAGNNSDEYGAASLLFTREPSNTETSTLTIWGVVTSVFPENFDEATVTHNNAPGLGLNVPLSAANPNLVQLGTFVVTGAVNNYEYVFTPDNLAFLNAHRTEAEDTYVTFYLTTNNKGYLHSKESNPSGGPRLSVTAVPEPTSMSLLAVALVGLRRRRVA